MNRHKGFTLIEMLTVIAIISVLVAIIIPVLGGTTGRAKAAACAANRRAAMACYDVYLLGGGKALSSSDAVMAYVQGENDGGIVCPGGGVISYDLTRKTFVCSKHKDSAGVSSADAAKTFTEEFSSSGSKLFAAAKTLGTGDAKGALSGSGSSSEKALLAAAQAAGVDLSQFKAWKLVRWDAFNYVRNHYSFAYTDQDISALKPGDKVSVRKWNYQYDNSTGKYTGVWQTGTVKVARAANGSMVLGAISGGASGNSFANE